MTHCMTAQLHMPGVHACMLLIEGMLAVLLGMAKTCGTCATLDYEQSKSETVGNVQDMVL